MRKLEMSICDCAVCPFYTAIEPDTDGIDSVCEETGTDSVCEETGTEFIHNQHEIPEWCPLQKI